MTATFRRHVIEAVGTFDERFVNSGDRDFLLRIVRRFHGACLAGAHCVWRRSEIHLMSNHGRVLEYAIEALEKNFDATALSWRQRLRVRRRMAAFAGEAAYIRFDREEYREMRALALRGIRHCFWVPWGYGYVVLSLLGGNAIRGIRNLKRALFPGKIWRLW
jgi:hypothetical protein